MLRFQVRTIILAGSIGLGGCSGVPQFDTPSPFTVAHIVDKVECEIAEAVKRHRRLTDEPWLAVADLTLQVDDSIDLTPKLSFIRPLATDGTNFTFGAGAEFKRARTRIYTETLEIPITKKLKKHSCNKLRDEFDLTGDLGIVETIELGLTSYDHRDPAGFPVTEDKKPAFGETVQFVITKNVTGVGPTWTLVHFVGPGGILGLERVDTHKLIISFARLKPGSPTARVLGSVGAAAARASDQNYKMLLQSIPTIQLRR